MKPKYAKRPPMLVMRGLVNDKLETRERIAVEPDRAGLLAAAEPLREQIRALVMELHKMRPTRRPVTMQQAAAWRRFQKAMGNDAYAVEYASVGEIADAVVDLILKGEGK